MRSKVRLGALGPPLLLGKSQVNTPVKSSPVLVFLSPSRLGTSPAQGLDFLICDSQHSVQYLVCRGCSVAIG